MAGAGEVEVGLDDLKDERSVESALAATLLAEQGVEKELEEMMSTVGVNSKERIDGLLELAKKTANVDQKTGELKDLVSGASRLAETVASKVRDLDAMYRRCENALQRVEDVIALRSCAEGVRNALASSDLESACAHVGRFLQLGESAKAELDVESGISASVSQVNDSIADLTRAIRERATLAAKGQSVEKVAAVAKLFVPIGHTEEGLDIFGNFLKAAVHRECAEDIRAILIDKSMEVEEEPHIVCLTRLFESVAAYLDESEKTIVDNFGVKGLIVIAQEMQAQCDEDAERILARYTQDRRLDEMSLLLNQRSADARVLDPLLDEQAVISQRTMRYLAFLSSRVTAVIQEKFGSSVISANGNSRPEDITGDDLERKASRALKSPGTPGRGSLSAGSVQRTPSVPMKGGHPSNGGIHRTPSTVQRTPSSAQRTPSMLAKKAPEPSPAETLQHEFTIFLRSCGLEKAVEELTTRYVSMEAYFMQANVVKATSIDEAPPPGSNIRTSTAVDDVFFVLQKCIRRAVSYANLGTLCAIVNYVNLAIGGELLDYAKRRLNETRKLLDRVKTTALSRPLRAVMLSDASSVHSEGGPPPYGYLIALNNAQLSSEFALRLRTELLNKATDAFNTQRDHAQINAALAQFSESSRAFASLMEESLGQLVEALTARLRSAIDALDKVSYLLEESEYQDQERGEHFLRTFIVALETQALGDLEDHLTEANWDGHVRRLAEWSAKKLESALLGTGNGDSPKRFNALGALQLDRDVRALSNFFASNSRRGTVRDVFARLSQIAMLVNFEKPSEVYDLWGPNSGGMTWRLTPSEVRKALALRVDFNADAVRALRL